MSVLDRVRDSSTKLTGAERKVADVVIADPRVVAFGTVAEVAALAQTSGPSVVRFAAKLGFDGFVGLQAAVQSELASRLAPAAERIRERSSSDVLGRAIDAEVANVRTTLADIDRDVFQGAVDHLADRHRAVWVLAGEMSDGVGRMLALQLDALRDGVRRISGTPLAVARNLAEIRPGDVVVAIDFRRYEQWVVESLTAAVQAGASVIAITDRVLSPLAEVADHTFVVTAASVSPFDSHVGTMALANAFVAGVASRLRRTAMARLDVIETAWANALTPSED